MVWTAMPRNGNLPPKVEGAVIEYYDNYIYVAGGQATSSAARYPNGFFRYNLLTSAWEDVSNPSSSYLSRLYTGSALIDGYFYLLSGWSSYLGADVQDYMRVSLTSPDFAWEVFDTTPPYIIDSFAVAIINSEIYIFAGYDNNLGVYINTFVSLDPSTSVITEITSNYLTPSARSSHSMFLIDNNLYIFGGVSGSALLNDMWVFEILSGVWSIAQTTGTLPTPRSDFAYGSEGNALVIWGGIDSTGLIEDLFMFNTLTLQWTQIISTSSSQPSPAAGACLVLQMPNIYIYGGITSYGFSGELWQYNLGTNTYTLVSTDNQLAYASCQLLGNHFYVIFGYSYAEVPVPMVRSFDLVSLGWQSFYIAEAADSDTAQGIQLLMGAAVIRVAGQSWGFDPHRDALVLSYNNSYDVGSIPEASYAQACAYYNTSLYCFGGGSSISSLLRMDVAHNRLFSIDTQGICEGGMCEVLCSEGTYQTSGGCEVCPSGYFAEGMGNSECTACSIGTHNANTGATSKRECYPCPQGYFNNEAGASRCLQCEASDICPIGSVYSGNILSSTQQKSIQPLLYSANSESMNLTVAQVCIGLLIFIGILSMLSMKKVRAKLSIFDIFRLDQTINEKGRVEGIRTVLGGIFALVFVVLALILSVSMLFSYELSNVNEEKSLVPLVTLQDNVVDFVAGMFTVNLAFLTYGDSCTVNKVCSPNISLAVTNIRSKISHYECELTSDNSCNIYFTCINCIIDTGAILAVELNQQLSYASGIYVNVTSDSSILGQPSSILSKINSDANHIIIGASPTNFYFTATASYFTSESSAWPAQATGYHISSEVNPVVGSQYLNIDLPTVSQLKLNVHLEKSSSSLYTKRTLKQTWLLLLSAIIGSVFGIKGAVGGIMMASKIAGSKIVSRALKTSKFRYIKDKRKELEDFIEQQSIEKKDVITTNESSMADLRISRNRLRKVFQLEDSITL